MIPRHEAIEKIIGLIREDDLIVSTTGMVSRELFYKRDRERNFYMIGSMGLASAFGLGLASQLPESRVFVLDGDGSVLMSMGTLPLIATEAPKNLVHVALDNEVYESTGSQPSIAADVSLAEIARASGYQSVWEADDERSIQGAFAECEGRPGPHFVLIKVSIAPVEDIPRVSHAPLEIRDRFRNGIESTLPKALSN